MPSILRESSYTLVIFNNIVLFVDRFGVIELHI
jgi:hypothetical protein